MRSWKEILERHRKWLNDEDGGERADLREANLREPTCVSQPV
ncbi:MAG: hypothetical protein ACLTKQ_08310 [Acutalibacteraceae bacterium]